MRTNRLNVIAGLILVLALGARPATAAELYTFTVGVLGGAGGSLDADPGDDLSNRAYQLNLSIVTEPKTHLGLRIGQVDFTEADPLGRLTDASLTYVTVGGEYRSSQSFYESGVFLGLGAYRLDGNLLATGADQSDDTFGLTLGLTGEFEMTRRLGFLVEIAGHWADFDEQQIFLTGHVGLAIHF